MRAEEGEILSVLMAYWVKLVAPNDRNLKVIAKLHRSIAQTSPVFPPLSEARASLLWYRLFPEDPHGTGVPHVLINTGKRGCEPPSPLSPAGDRAGRGGEHAGRRPTAFYRRGFGNLHQPVSN